MEVGAALGGILFLLVLLSTQVFWVWALVDAARSSDAAPFRVGTKTLWIIVIALANFIGSVVYFLIGRPRTA